MSNGAAAPTESASGEPRAPGFAGLFRPVRRNADLLMLGAVYVALYVLPKHAPLGVQVRGGLDGALLALQAIGIVLILRASKIINFAQAQLGALTGVIFYQLVRHVQLAVFAVQVCAKCFRGVPTDSVYIQSHPQKFVEALQATHHGGWVVANFWVSLVLSLLLAPLLGWIVYVLVIRRFAEAPRLIATVATIAVGSVLTYLAASVGRLFPEVTEATGPLPVSLPKVDAFIPPIRFHAGDLLGVIVVPLLLVGLVLVLRFTNLGAVMEAVADNARRALTLGIGVTRVASASWALAGLFSGVAAILGVLGTGGSSTGVTGLFDVVTLVQILTAVVFARMGGLWLAALASLVLGIVDQVFLWNFNSPVPYQGLLLLPLLAGALLLQRSKESRAEMEATASYLGAREARPMPQELRHIPVVDSSLRFGAFVLAAFVLGFPFFMTPAQVSLGSNALIFGIIGLSLLVLTGWAGQISLGQFAFAAIGGYVTTYLAGTVGLFMFASLILGGLAGAGMSLLVGVPALRLRGFHLAAVTLALSLATTLVVTSRDFLGRFLPQEVERPTILGFSLKDEKTFYFVCLALLILCAVAVAGLRRGRTARVLIACRDNEQAGQSFGISLFRARLEAFAISGFLAAFAGGLLVYHEHGLQAQAFGPDQSLNAFLIVILGGLGSILGPLLGVVFYGALNLFNNPLVALLGTGLGTLIVMLAFPGGLAAIAFQVRDAMLRRVAIRNRIEVPALLGEKGVQAMRGRAAIAPKLRPGGGTAFVPDRYSLAGQLADAEVGSE